MNSKRFPWWTIILALLFVRWGILLSRHPERAPGVLGLLVGIVIVPLVSLYLLKLWMQNKLQKMQNAYYVPVDMAQYAGAPGGPQAVNQSPIPDPSAPGGGRPSPRLPLDFAGIDQWSQAFHGLGFSWVMDYSLDEQSQKISPGKGICRLLIKPDECIYACIRQTVMNNQALPVRPALYGFLEDGGEIITIAANALDTNLALHRPQDVYDFMSGTSPQELLARHRERRHQVGQYMGRRVRPDISPDFYMNYEKSGVQRTLDAYRRTNVFRLVQYLFTMNSTRSLLGELGSCMMRAGAPVSA